MKVFCILAVLALGVVRKSSVNGQFPITPVDFYLYTKKNPMIPQRLTQSSESIRGSFFDARNPTKFFIHGWTQSAANNPQISAAWLGRGRYNVILVDWASARNMIYPQAAAAVPNVGKKIASFIDFLVANHGVNLNDIEVIGHSLGAHVAGFTGKNVKSGKLPVIIGLDPALPLFTNPNQRLNQNDAKFVESVHTNGGGYGILEPVGHADFYVNGGRNQPACFLNTFCSHALALMYYAQAVSRNGFQSVKCTDYNKAVNQKCGGSPSNVKMDAKDAQLAKGVYYVRTH